MRRLFIVLGIISMFAMAGCEIDIQPIRPYTLIPVPSATSTPEKPSATEVFNPAEMPEETPFAGDLPAYVQAGLPTRDKMSEWMERYYYEPDFYNDTPSDIYEKYNVEFENETKADLDGDGKDDIIKLLPGKERTISDDDSMTGDFWSITVSINGKELKMEENRYSAFSLTGLIMDIDKDDSRKELLIQRNHGEGDANYVITYDGKSPKIVYILDDELNGIIADGSGYMNFLTDDIVRYYDLKHWKTDGSGFEEADIDYLFTEYLNYYLDGHEEGDGYAQTQWDQKLAGKPGGKESIMVKKGTDIFYGLCYRMHYLQVLGKDGNTLGWMKIKNTYYDEYTGYFFSEYVDRP